MGLTAEISWSGICQRLGRPLNITHDPLTRENLLEESRGVADDRAVFVDTLLQIEVASLMFRILEREMHSVHQNVRAALSTFARLLRPSSSRPHLLQRPNPHRLISPF